MIYFYNIVIMSMQCHSIVFMEGDRDCHKFTFVINRVNTGYTVSRTSKQIESKFYKYQSQIIYSSKFIIQTSIQNEGLRRLKTTDANLGRLGKTKKCEQIKLFKSRIQLAPQVFRNPAMRDITNQLLNQIIHKCWD